MSLSVPEKWFYCDRITQIVVTITNKALQKKCSLQKLWRKTISLRWWESNTGLPCSSLSLLTVVYKNSPDLLSDIHSYTLVTPPDPHPWFPSSPLSSFISCYAIHRITQNRILKIGELFISGHRFHGIDSLWEINSVVELILLGEGMKISEASSSYVVYGWGKDFQHTNNRARPTRFHTWFLLNSRNRFFCP